MDQQAYDALMYEFYKIVARQTPGVMVQWQDVDDVTEICFRVVRPTEQLKLF